MIKKIIFLTFFSLSFTNTTQSKNNNYFMLVGLPRSGSTFFFKMLTQANPEKESKNEFFNRMINPANIKNEFKIKTQKFSYTNILLPEYYLNQFYKDWKKHNFQMTKEVFYTFHIPYFIQHFNLFGIYRHRKYTFPSTSRHTGMYKKMFDNFVKADYSDHPLLDAIQNYIKQQKLTRNEKNVTIQVINYFILLHYATMYHFPVIDYEEIMSLEDQDLYNYLEKRVPEKIFNTQLIEQLLEERIQDNDFLEKRLEKYQNFNVEDSCQELLSFLKTLDVEMNYWNLLE